MEDGTWRRISTIFATLVLLIPGCFGSTEEIVVGNDWAEGFSYIDDPAGFTGEDRIRPFNVSHPDPTVNE